VDCSKERCGVFGVARGDPAPALEVKKCIFNQMAQLVNIDIILTLLFAISLWRNDRFHALRVRLIDDSIAIIALISQQIFGADAFN